MTDLTLTVSKIGFLDGKQGKKALVRYCKDPEALRKVVSEGFYQVMSLYADTSEKAVSLMVPPLLEQYSSEPVEVFTNVIKKLATGQVKVYGRITPDLINELITEQLETLTLDREAEHADNKGYGAFDPGPRRSSRIQEPQRLKDYLKK